MCTIDTYFGRPQNLYKLMTEIPSLPLPLPFILLTFYLRHLGFHLLWKRTFPVSVFRSTLRNMSTLCLAPTLTPPVRLSIEKPFAERNVKKVVKALRLKST